LSDTPRIDTAAVPDTAVVYSSSRITITTVTEADLPLLWAAMQTSDFDRFWPPPHPQSYPALVARFRWLQQLGDVLEIDAIASATRTGEAFAWIKLSAIDTYHRKAEISVYLHHLRGTRVAYEAVSASIDLAMGLVDKVLAHTTPVNEPAIRLLRRLGFVEEGRFREEVVGRDGTRQDVLRFGLLKTEWMARPRPAWLGQAAEYLPAKT
jgi:RimJ/RimL family protein N-acetyltransferase